MTMIVSADIRATTVFVCQHGQHLGFDQASIVFLHVEPLIACGLGAERLHDLSHLQVSTAERVSGRINLA